MKRFLATLVVGVAALAFAGDRFVGVISVIDTTKTNASQNPDAGPNSWDGGIYQPFPITPGALLTIQCDTESYVATDSATATSLNGVRVTPNSIFLTSVAGDNSATITRVGADTMRTARVAILPVVTDGGTKSCRVFERNGKE